jgi:hypothetical protein
MNIGLVGKHIIKLTLLWVLSLVLWKIFVFSHPYPNRILETYFIFQYIISALGFLHSSKLGRIFVVILALCTTRVFGLGYPPPNELITNAPVFIGGIFGIGLKVIMDQWSQSPFEKSIRERAGFRKNLDKSFDWNFYLSIIGFFLVLGLDRFLVYYNAPFLIELNQQELLYNPNFYSKQLFAYSIDLLSGLVFPVLFFMADEKTFPKNRASEFSLGVLWSLAIQATIILIQTYIDISFLQGNTNNAESYFRASGLFRDAGSASLILPCLLVVTLDYIFKIKWQWSPVYNLLLFFLIGIILGYAQGRSYWVVLSLGYLWVTLKNSESLPFNNFRFKIFIISLLSFILIFSGHKIFQKHPNLLNDIQERNWINLDSNRFFLNKVGLYEFRESPWFGNGVASIPVALSNPSHPIPNPEKIIDNPSFYLGILNDIGIIGIIVVLIWTFYHYLLFRSKLALFLLFIVGFSGYHVVHPDSAFWLLLFNGALFPRKGHYPQLQIKLTFLVALISFLFLGNIFFKLKNGESGPEFRYSINNKYQDYIYENNIPALDDTLLNYGIRKYHNLKGSRIWKLKPDVKKLSLRLFLSSATRQSKLTLKISFYTKEKVILDEMKMELEKWKPYLEIITLPEKTYYIRIDEIGKKGEPILSGNHIYSIDAENINLQGELEN